MTIKQIIKIALVVIPLLGVVSISTFFVLLPKNEGDKTVNILPDGLYGWRFPQAKFPATGVISDSLAYSDIRDPGGIPSGLPVRLKIPVIDVDSAIEDALITSDGRMDVPAGSINVAWFSLGPHPGQIGSAVIGGHFGIKGGIPFVFYHLDKLKKNDKVYIIDDNGDILTFVVRTISTFDRNADATTVFTSKDGQAHLNLITCEGIWNQVNGTYPKRLVIFTDAIPPEKNVAAGEQKNKIVNPTQTLFPLPTPLSDRHFQTNNDASKVTTTINQLYQTPFDSLVTIGLLVSMIFVFFKIVRG